MLKFRPHHFLCTLGFRGKGYSEKFVAAYTEIADSLRNEGAGDGVVIRVESGADSICEACPNRLEQRCESQERVEALDRAHAAILGISPGEVIHWGEAKRRIREHMSLEKFHMACSVCPWKSAGYCEAALRELLEKV